MHNRSSERAARVRQESTSSADASRRPSDRPPKSSSRVIARSTPPPAEPFPSAPEAPAKRKKILLVDDSMTALMMNRMLLSKSGCDILTARDGREALAIAASEKPDLIIMDVVMPQMSGLELSKQVTDRRPTVKVLCVSGQPDEAIVNHGLLGAQLPLLEKPFTPEMLVRKVSEMLEGARA